MQFESDPADKSRDPSRSRVKHHEVETTTSDTHKPRLDTGITLPSRTEPSTNKPCQARVQQNENDSPCFRNSPQLGLDGATGIGKTVTKEITANRGPNGNSSTQQLARWINQRNSPRLGGGLRTGPTHRGPGRPANHL